MSTCNIVAALVAVLVSSCGFLERGLADEVGATHLSTAVIIRVDASGLGDFEKIQDAVDAVLLTTPGTTSSGEQVVIPADKPYITLSGTQASTTILIWSQGNDIFKSPILTIFASHFVALYITIQNIYGGKAVAVRVAGDKAAFYSCRFISFQDTILDDAGSHYFTNCYIEGATDFICGSGSSLYEKCHLHSVAEGKGIITAQHRLLDSEATGFTFLGCKITGINSTYLGRPWGAYSRVVFAYTFMSSAVLPEGWDDWAESTRRSTVYYGEYRNYGLGADRSKRVTWSRTLTDEEVAPFMTKGMIGGRDWLRPSPKHFVKYRN